MESEKQIPTQQENEAEKINPDKVLEFENLTAEQAEELKGRIKEHNGLIRIFIHILETPKEQRQKNLSAVKRILESENTPPVFFLEDTRVYKLLEKLLSGEDHNSLLKKQHI